MKNKMGRMFFFFFSKQERGGKSRRIDGNEVELSESSSSPRKRDVCHA